MIPAWFTPLPENPPVDVVGYRGPALKPDPAVHKTWRGVTWGPDEDADDWPDPVRGDLRDVDP